MRRRAPPSSLPTVLPVRPPARHRAERPPAGPLPLRRGQTLRRAAAERPATRPPPAVAGFEARRAAVPVAVALAWARQLARRIARCPSRRAVARPPDVAAGRRFQRSGYGPIASAQRPGCRQTRKAPTRTDRGLRTHRQTIRRAGSTRPSSHRRRQTTRLRTAAYPRARRMGRRSWQAKPAPARPIASATPRRTDRPSARTCHPGDAARALPRQSAARSRRRRAARGRRHAAAGVLPRRPDRRRG